MSELTQEECRALLGRGKPKCDCGGALYHAETCSAKGWWDTKATAIRKLVAWAAPQEEQGDS